MTNSAERFQRVLLTAYPPKPFPIDALLRLVFGTRPSDAELSSP